MMKMKKLFKNGFMVTINVVNGEFVLKIVYDNTSKQQNEKESEKATKSH